MSTVLAPAEYLPDQLLLSLSLKLVKPVFPDL